jgi:YaiO family outer membrane protein
MRDEVGQLKKMNNLKKFCAFAALAILLSNCPGIVSAQPDQAAAQTLGNKYLREPYAYRFESTLTYEHLDPNSDYGDWKSVDAACYARIHRQATAFAQASHHARVKEGSGQTLSAGAYVDWLSRLSTYSALSRGFGEDFLPVYRIDHDFSFLHDPFVFTIGASYIDYEGEQRDWILSAGATLYHHRWIAEYRLFRNTSDPGGLVSYTHLLSLGYGEEGWRWIFLKFSLGAQAYQARMLSQPEDVRQDAWEFSLHHRHWLGQDWGLMERIGFLSLEDGYDKYAVSVGFFKEF